MKIHTAIVARLRGYSVASELGRFLLSANSFKTVGELESKGNSLSLSGEIDMVSDAEMVNLNISGPGRRGRVQVSLYTQASFTCQQNHWPFVPLSCSKRVSKL